MRILFTIIISFFLSSVIGLCDVYETVDVGGGNIQWYNTTTNTAQTPPSIIDAGDTVIVHHQLATCDETTDLNFLPFQQANCVYFFLQILRGTLITKPGSEFFTQGFTVQTTGALYVNSNSTILINGTLSNDGGFVENNGLIRFNGSLNNSLGGTITGSGGVYDCNGSLKNNDDVSDVTCFHGDCTNFEIPCTGVLPLELTHFELIEQNEGLRLAWETEGLDNRAYFIVEGSDDGRTWDEITMIQGKTSNGSTNHYHYDLSATESFAFYRLKYIEADLEPVYSHVVSHTKNFGKDVTITKDGNILRVRPNDTDAYSISVYSSAGTLIHEEMELDEEIQIEIPEHGIFILQISTPVGISREKVLF